MMVVGGEEEGVEVMDGDGDGREGGWMDKERGLEVREVRKGIWGIILALCGHGIVSVIGFKE